MSKIKQVQVRFSAIALHLAAPVPLGDRPPDTFWDVAH